MVAIYRWFLRLPVPVREQIIEMPWEKVSKVVGLINQANAEVWLEKMRVHTSEGLRKEVQLYGGETIPKT
jgi:hypothetical protein